MVGKIKKLISVLLSASMILPFFSDKTWAEENVPRSVAQTSVYEIESYPKIPTPTKIIDWKQRALDYDAFVYNWSPTDNRKHHTIFVDQTNDTFKLPPYYGDDRIAPDGSQDSLSTMGSIISATLVGIDKSNQDGYNYVEKFKKFYWDEYGIVGPNVNFGEGAWKTHWYTLFSNILFYEAADLYPEWGVDAELRSIAEKVYGMVVALGGENANFNHQGFDFNAMEPRDGTWKEPDAAAATATILYWAYKKFGDEKYLQGAIWSMDYLEKIDFNPYYEILLNHAGNIAAQLNAFHGKNYNITKYMRWQLAERSTVREWGTAKSNWAGYDMHGIAAAHDTKESGYAFAMNTFYPVSTYVPMVRYDQSYAKAVGKWVLNIANSARYFYADEWSPEHQTYPEFIGKPESVIAYEGLRRRHNGVNMVASGDPSVYRIPWNLGPDATDLGLYGGGFVGFLGGVVKPTNHELILRLDATKTDFYADSAYPTYLYYNPYDTAKSVEIILDEYSDLFDAVSGRMIATNVRGNVNFTINSDDVRLIVVAPANSTITYDETSTYLNGVFVAHKKANHPVYSNIKVNVPNLDFSAGTSSWDGVNGSVQIEDVISLNGVNGFVAIRLPYGNEAGQVQVGDELFMEFDAYVDRTIVADTNPRAKITTSKGANVVFMSNAEMALSERGKLKTFAVPPVGDGKVPNDGSTYVWCYVYNYNQSMTSLDVKDIRIWGKRDGQRVDYTYDRFTQNGSGIPASWTTRAAVPRSTVLLSPGAALTRSIPLGDAPDQFNIGDKLNMLASVYLEPEQKALSSTVVKIRQGDNVLADIKDLGLVDKASWRELSGGVEGGDRVITTIDPLTIEVRNDTDSLIRIDDINVSKLVEVIGVETIDYNIPNLNFENNMTGWNRYGTSAIERVLQLKDDGTLSFPLDVGTDANQPQVGDRIFLEVNAYLDAEIDASSVVLAKIETDVTDAAGQSNKTILLKTYSGDIPRGVKTTIQVPPNKDQGFIEAGTTRLWVKLYNAGTGKTVDIANIKLWGERNGNRVNYTSFTDPVIAATGAALPIGWEGANANLINVLSLQPGSGVYRNVTIDVPHNAPHRGDKVLVEADAFLHSAAAPDNQVIARVYDSNGSTRNTVIADVDNLAGKTKGRWQTYLSTKYNSGIIGDDANYFVVQLHNSTNQILRMDAVRVIGKRGLLSAEEIDKTALKNAIGQSEVLIATDYTESSFNNLQTVLSAARKVRDNDYATTDEVASATLSLQTILSALERIPATEEHLKALIAEASNLKQADYTIDSWSRFVVALACAQEDAANETILQSEVNAVTRYLKLRMVELEKSQLVGATIFSPIQILERNQTVTMSVYGTLSNGYEADLTHSLIEYFSDNPEVIRIDGGKLTAGKTGVAQVYVKVSLDGKSVLSNSLTFHVSTSITAIQRLISQYETSGNLSGALIVQLSNRLEQADHHLSDGKKDQAIKHMEDFIKALYNPPHESFISPEAQWVLDEDANALISIWGSRLIDTKI